MYINSPASLLAFASLRMIVQSGISKSHDGILSVRRDSGNPNRWNCFPELEMVVVTSVVLLRT